jgi:hypothetical protein
METIEMMRKKQQIRINTIATFAVMWNMYVKTGDENLLVILEKAVDDFIAKEYK